MTQKGWEIEPQLSVKLELYTNRIAQTALVDLATFTKVVTPMDEKDWKYLDARTYVQTLLFKDDHVAHLIALENKRLSRARLPRGPLFVQLLKAHNKAELHIASPGGKVTMQEGQHVILEPDIPYSFSTPGRICFFYDCQGPLNFA